MSSSATATNSQSVSGMRSGKFHSKQVKTTFTLQCGMWSLSFGSGLARAVCRVKVLMRGGGVSRVKEDDDKKSVGLSLYSPFLYAYTGSPLCASHSIPVLQYQSVGLIGVTAGIDSSRTPICLLVLPLLISLSFSSVCQLFCYIIHIPSWICLYPF